MLLKSSIKLFFLLSLITILALNSVHAKKSKKPKVNNDKFYIVIAENGSNDGKNKREEKEQFLNSLVTEINNLIIGNKDTYDDPSMLKKLEEAPVPETPFTKRSVIEDEEDEEDDEEEEPENKFAYVISSLDKKSLIYSYLSEDLVPLVKDMPNVKHVMPDFELHFSSNRNKHLKEIKETYKWEHPCVKGNAYNHLSLISQDKYDDSKNGTTYDENYYYPSSAGEGINLFILDSGFNFKHEEYSNASTKNEKKERIATCIAALRYNCLYYDINRVCHDNFDEGHGNVVADVAAGLTRGVASRANIYGVAIQESGQQDTEKIFVSSLIQGLELINSRYLDETNPENVEKFIHKSVINMSCGYFLTEEERITIQEKKEFTDYLGNLIKEMSNKGSVIVASAGNYETDVKDIYYPCTFDDVICVGATDNIGINDDYYTANNLYLNRYNTTLYPSYSEWEKLFEEAKSRYFTNNEKFYDNKFIVSKNYRRAHFSSFGKKVDIYAPGFVKALYIGQNGENQEGNWSGTSFSSPIVAGVAATIMSEKPYIKYTTSEMRKELQEIGLKGIIQDVDEDHPNIFVNNGKHLSYNYDNDEEDDEDLAELECYRHGCCLRD